MNAIDAETLRAVIGELAPLVGAKIQRVDVYDDVELVLGLRVPGRTFELLVSARPGEGRVHLIDRRPAKSGAGSALQGLLRKHLEGRRLVGVSAEGLEVSLALPDGRLVADLAGGRRGFRLVPSAPGAPEPDERAAADLAGRAFPTSDALAERFRADHPARVERRRRALLAPLERRRRQLERLLENLDDDRARLLALGEARRLGELLKPVVHRTPRGAREVQVTDWETGAEVAIPLDPALGPVANLERLFARAKRADRGLPVVAARRAKIEAEHRELCGAIARLASADPAELAASPAPAEPPASAPTKAGPIREIDRVSRRFVSRDGHEIRVGKGGEANARLTFAHARGHDLWLHARGVPGAHVVLRLEKGKSATPDALLDAAHLAVHFSDAKGEPQADVIAVEARHVRTKKGLAPGQVLIAKEKTLRLRVEPERLDRLLARGPV